MELHHSSQKKSVAFIYTQILTGGTPYGATTIANADGSRQPTENELKIAAFQGQHIARIAAKMFG